MKIIMEKGLKSATMDGVAASLGISKRTLYELFDSKQEMITAVLEAARKKNMEFLSATFEESPNMMEALIKVFRHTRDVIGSINVEFYRDMDRLYKDNRADFDKTYEMRNAEMERMYRRGVEQEMFRPDVDFSVQCRAMSLQMEALKRIEELFPPDITMERVYDAITISFLRSIASPKGMGILDQYTKNINKI